MDVIDDGGIIINDDTVNISGYSSSASSISGSFLVNFDDEITINETPYTNNYGVFAVTAINVTKPREHLPSFIRWAWRYYGVTLTAVMIYLVLVRKIQQRTKLRERSEIIKNLQANARKTGEGGRR